MFKIDPGAITFVVGLLTFILGIAGTVITFMVKDAKSKASLQGKDQLTDNTIKSLEKLINEKFKSFGEGLKKETDNIYRQIDMIDKTDRMQENTITSLRENYVSLKSEHINLEKRFNKFEAIQLEETKTMQKTLVQLEKSIHGIDATMQGLTNVLNMLLADKNGKK